MDVEFMKCSYMLRSDLLKFFRLELASFEQNFCCKFKNQIRAEVSLKGIQPKCLSDDINKHSKNFVFALNS